MPLNREDAGVPQDEHARHIQRSIEQLDEGIARLAIALGLSLDSHADLLRAIQGGREVDGQLHDGVAHREEASRKELQGLLVLRYELIRQYSESAGPEATRHMMLAVEQRLNMLGFRKGADGIDVTQLEAADEGGIDKGRRS